MGGMTLGKGTKGNVVKNVTEGGAFAKNKVQVGWAIVKVNRTKVDANTAYDTLKYAMKQGGEVKIEFGLPASNTKVMFDGKKKCGFTLEPKSNVVKTVDKRGVAGKGGVQPGWIVRTVDGTNVSEESVRSALKRAAKSPKKYFIFFEVTDKKNRNKMLMSIQASPGEQKDNEKKVTEDEQKATEDDLRAKEEAEQQAKLKAIEEEEQKLKMEAEQKLKEEAEQKAKEDAEQLAKEEAEQKAREEAERIAQEEAEKRAKEEAELKAREEAERIAQEEAEKKAQEEERKLKMEAEQKLKEEAEQKAKEDAERLAREEAEQKVREEAERKAREEAEQKAQEEAEKKAREEA